MSWEAIGAIADLIASAAVVVSLIYLGLQIRNQTTESRIASANDLAIHTYSIYSPLATNKLAASMALKGFLDFDSLDETEAFMFTVGNMQYFRGMEALYYQHKMNRVDPAIWSGLDAHVQDVCSFPGNKRFWVLRKHIFSEDFKKYLEPYFAREGSPNFNQET